MRKISDISAYVFIVLVLILSAISILGVWNFLADDVISKSFLSMGLLALVAVIILVADHFIDRHVTTPDAANLVAGPQQTGISESQAKFKSLRVFTLTILILSVALLALLGVMAIWEVLSGEVLHKSLVSIAIVAFSSLVVVITCLERENNPILFRDGKISGGMVILIFLLMWIILPFIFSSTF